MTSLTGRTPLVAVAVILSCTSVSIAPASADCSQHIKGEKKMETTLTKDIVDTAQSAGSFGTLVTALKEAGLVETLKGEGPFTVFAPTDEAFKKIPADQLAALLKDKAKLTKVLTFHVVSGSVKAEDVVKLTTANSVEGSPLAISVSSDGVKIEGAKVTATDILCSNGVVHVIDTVILPPSL
jgi:transforming growth factor-beta-induced protein